MLSDRFYHLIFLIVCPMAKIGILKYDWNPNTNLFVPIAYSKRHLNRFITFLSLTFLFVWILFLLIQIFRFYYHGNIDSLAFVVSCVINLSILSLSCIMCTLSADKLFPAINSFIIFLRMVNGK